jgi:hypothetical protein
MGEGGARARARGHVAKIAALPRKIDIDERRATWRKSISRSPARIFVSAPAYVYVSTVHYRYLLRAATWD